MRVTEGKGHDHSKRRRHHFLVSDVSGLLTEHASRTPEMLALSIDGRTLTWKELVCSVAVAARVLDEDPRAPRGASVGIFMRNSIEWAVWAYACAVTARTIVPLNIKLLESELAYQLEQSDCALVFAAAADSDLLERLSKAILKTARSGGTEVPACVAVDQQETSGTSRHDATDVLRLDWLPPVPDETTLIIQYTSGTTAQPKGVVLAHGQVILNARGVAERLQLTREDRIASPSPFFHVAGTTLLLFLGLVSGASVFSFSRFDPEMVLDVLERERITIYNGVDSLFVGLLKAPSFAKERLRSVRTGWIASSQEVVLQVHTEMGLPGIVNVYGISECSPNVTIPDVEDPPAVRRTCGRPHSGTEVRIADITDGRTLERGEVGLIEVRGPCVMRGYYRKPRETADVFGPDGWLRTGDRGYLDEDGNLVYLGREKDMLRVGGENVAPAEVEAAILEHPSVAMVAVIGMPHPILQEVPVAFVVPREGARLESRGVRDFLANRLASFKVPYDVRIVDSLPMTGSEKVQKYRLRDMLLER